MITVNHVNIYYKFVYFRLEMLNEGKSWRPRLNSGGQGYDWGRGQCRGTKLKHQQEMKLHSGKIATWLCFHKKC